MLGRLDPAAGRRRGALARAAAGAPRAVAERRLSEVVFHRRWLVDSVERWIDSPPWRTDYQGRLRRNVPGLWRFDGLVHTDGDVLGERRFVELPVSLIWSSRASSVARAEPALRPRRRARCGTGSHSTPPSLPERFEDLSTRPVPVEDRPPLQALVDSTEATARSRTAGAGAAPVQELEFGQVDRFNGSARPTQVALRETSSGVCPGGAAGRHRRAPRREGPQPRRFPVAAGGGPVLGPGQPALPRPRKRKAGGRASRAVHGDRVAGPGVGAPGPRSHAARSRTYVLELDVAFEHRRFGDGPRREVTVLPSAPTSVNGNLDALAEAAGAARALSDIERRRDESEMAATRPSSHPPLSRRAPADAPLDPSPVPRATR